MADRPISSVEAEDLIEQVCRRLARESLSPHRQAAVRTYSGAIRPGAADPRDKTDAPTSGPVESGKTVSPDEVAVRLDGLEESLRFGFERALKEIGIAPPGPATVRGFAGRLFIRCLRSLLWWYTRSVMTFGDAVGKQFYDEAALLTAMARAQEEQRAEIASLREEIRQLRDNQSAERQ